MLLASASLALAAVGLVCRATASYISSTYDWDSRSAAEQAPCTGIPANLSLCQNIGYSRMRVPDLLEHDSLAEILEQSSSWIPLLNVRCHQDTQRFLCSLFTPVCVDPPISPCRSLCEKVKSGCESRMKMYGFPWPEMFACDRFPQDNDMCITSEMAANPSDVLSIINGWFSQTQQQAIPKCELDTRCGVWQNQLCPISQPINYEEEKCKVCEQVNTIENILDHYCQSNFAVRGKLRKVQHYQLTFKKVKLFKANTAGAREAFKSEFFQLNLVEDCCRERMRENRSSYFIMGTHDGAQLRPTFIMLWEAKRSKSFKKSIRMLRTVNCTNPSTIIDPKKAIGRSALPIHNTVFRPKHQNQTETRKGGRRNKKRKPKTKKNSNANANVNN